MYATCLFCFRPLARNERIESFPVGRRFAFDAAKGRLWVLCTRCARWNLTPLEERWEAIEQCERLFRDHRVRSQTDNIGLVRTRDGVELVRIGKPLRAEMAAWRYGAEFARRFSRRVALVGGTGIAAVAAGTTVVLSGGAVLAAQVALAPILLMPALQIAVAATGMRNRIKSTTIIGESGKMLRVVRADLDRARIIPSGSGEWGLHVQHSYGHEDLSGDRARRALEALLASINLGGASAGTVRRASDVLSDAGDANRVVELVAKEASVRSGDYEEQYAKFRRGYWMTAEGRNENLARSYREMFKRANSWTPVNRGALNRLPPAQRLALEMAVHERSEQYALDEELGVLEQAWREAEEIAAIADDLLVPDGTRRFIDAHKPPHE
jgi:hypothetical protein